MLALALVPSFHGILGADSAAQTDYVSRLKNLMLRHKQNLMLKSDNIFRAYTTVSD